MPALFPPTARRRLAWTFRTLAIALWLILGMVALVVAAWLDGALSVRGDLTTGQAVFAILAALFFLTVAAVTLRYCHRISRRWSRAAKIDPPPVAMDGIVTEMTRAGTTTHLTVDVHGTTWQLATESRADLSGLAGDPVAIELYGTHGPVLGAYRNARTARVRAIKTRTPW